MNETPLKPKNSQTVWANGDNDPFYQHIKSDGLRQFAEKAGLQSGCDLDAVAGYINNSKSILEVGAGYGRVIEYLLAHNYQGQITAIEKNAILFNELKTKYQDSVNLLNIDVLDSEKLGQKFDLILLMWSSIAGFSRSQQKIVIKNLSNLISTNGRLIVDTMAEHVKPFFTEDLGEQGLALTFENHTVYIYEPSQAEMFNYQKYADLEEIKKLNYLSKTKRHRLIYIFKTL